MKNVDILKAKDKQINKLIELVNKVLKALETQNQKTPVNPYVAPYVPITISTDQTCSDGGMHDYPNPWHGTTYPPCKKCGHIMPTPYGPTWTTGGTMTDGTNPYFDSGKSHTNSTGNVPMLKELINTSGDMNDINDLLE